MSNWALDLARPSVLAAGPDQAGQFSRAQPDHRGAPGLCFPRAAAGARARPRHSVVPVRPWIWTLHCRWSRRSTLLATTATRRHVRLSIAEGTYIRGTDVARQLALDSPLIGEPLANAPRHIELPDGGRCEVPDAAALARMLSAAGIGESSVVRLQKRWSWPGVLPVRSGLGLLHLSLGLARSGIDFSRTRCRPSVAYIAWRAAPAGRQALADATRSAPATDPCAGDSRPGRIETPPGACISAPRPASVAMPSPSPGRQHHLP